ncbi:hypothetical protein RI054_03g15280 [Pseudoscourfieldia marina]
MSVAEGNMSCVPATTMAVELPPDGHEEEVSSQPQEKEKEAVDCSLATGVAAAFERLARERARLLDAAGVVDEVTTTAQPQLQLQPQPQLQPHSKYFTKAMKIRVEAVPQFDALELAELRKQASIPEFISDEKLAQKVRELVGAASRAACAASSSTTLRGGKNVEHPLRQPASGPLSVRKQKAARAKLAEVAVQLGSEVVAAKKGIYDTGCDILIITCELLSRFAEKTERWVKEKWVQFDLDGVGGINEEAWIIPSTCRAQVLLAPGTSKETAVQTTVVVVPSSGTFDLLFPNTAAAKVDAVAYARTSKVEWAPRYTEGNYEGRAEMQLTSALTAEDFQMPAKAAAGKGAIAQQ